MEDTKDFRARLTKLEENVLQWEQRLQSANPGPETFHQMVSELRDSLDDLGRIGFQRLAQACEITDDTVVHQGRVYRFKQVVDKEWMTLWDKVRVPRRLFSARSGRPQPGALG